MAERDPRSDPRPGDVLIYGPQWQRERAEVKSMGEMHGNPVVFYSYVSGGSLHSANMPQWREWMTDAEVVKRGDD